MALIECERLCIGYGAKIVAKDISLKIEKNDYLYIIGENGSGKSTLMKTLLGLLPPVSGEIKFDGGLKKNEAGYLPQQKEYQRNFPASVWEVVLSGCQNDLGWLPFYTKKHKKSALKNLDLLGIPKLRKKSFSELSGGQQQRVLLARALCTAKKMLILDEPVTGLDPDAAEEMYSLIEKLNKEEGLTIVMISHDIAAAEKYAKHIYRMGK